MNFRNRCTIIFSLHRYDSKIFLLLSEWIFMTRLRWFGHSAFLLEIDRKKVLIDPWLSNPKSPVKPDDVCADIILITHDHGDHLGEAFDIAKRCNATIVCLYELAQEAKKVGVKKVIDCNIGGPVDIDGLKIVYTPAVHSAKYAPPTGVVIIGKKITVYHAGDTGVFGDMQLIGELYAPDVAILPIGGHYTMGPKEAAVATRLIEPRLVIPMHYGTFPILKGTVEEFKKELEARAIAIPVIAPSPGEWVNLEEHLKSLDSRSIS